MLNTITSSEETFAHDVWFVMVGVGSVGVMGNGVTAVLLKLKRMKKDKTNHNIKALMKNKSTILDDNEIDSENLRW